MARRTNFLGAAIRLSNAIAAEQRRTHNAAIRQHNAEIRYQNQLARELERERKQAERERLAQEKEQATQYAADKTSEAETKRSELTSLIKFANKSPIIVEWNSFKENEPFTKALPATPKFQPLPEKPDENKYSPKFGLLDWLSKSRKEKSILLAKERLAKAIDGFTELTRKVGGVSENGK